MIEADRGSKVPLDVRTLGPTGTLAQVEDGKGWKPDRGSQ